MFFGTRKWDNLSLWFCSEGPDDGGGGGGGGDDLGWRQDLPEDLRANETLAQFKGENEQMVKMPVSLAKSYVHARSMIGADTIKMPKTDEEWGILYDKLGRPKDKSQYILPVPENINPAMKEVAGKDAEWFRDIAHSVGLNDKTATTLFQKFIERVSNQYTQQTKVAQDEILNTEMQLRTEFGPTYDAKEAIGNRALEKLGGEKFMDVWNKLGLDRFPEFRRVKFKIGASMAEDLGLDKTTGNLLITKQEIHSQMETVMNSPAYLNGADPGHKAAVDKVASYMKQLHGDQPIPVTTGEFKF
jgi:hypothetical protein